MIDPLSAIIQLFRNDNELNTLVTGRIAAKHKFAMERSSHLGWPVPCNALQVSLEAGIPPDLYGGTLPFRLECRCYGQSQVQAGLIYHVVSRLIEGTERTLIRLQSNQPNQYALLYYLNLDSVPILIMEPELKIDMALIYIQGSFSSCSITQEI